MNFLYFETSHCNLKILCVCVEVGVGEDKNSKAIKQNELIDLKSGKFRNLVQLQLCPLIRHSF